MSAARGVGTFTTVDLLRTMRSQPVGAAVAGTPRGEVWLVVWAPTPEGAPRRLEVYPPGRASGPPAVTANLDGSGRRVAWRRILELLAGADADTIEEVGRFIDVVNTLDAVPTAALTPGTARGDAARVEALLAELRQLLVPKVAS